MAEILKGAPVAAAINEKTAVEVAQLRAEGIVPALAILRVGEGESNLAYERSAVKRCTELGIDVKSVVIPSGCSQEELICRIKALNEDKSVSGILMLRPLPDRLDEAAACEAVIAEKDVDGITSGSMARAYSGRGWGFAPCTAQACMEILNYYNISPQGKRAAIIGRSLVIGRPVAMLLMAQNATVTICHTKTQNVSQICKECDIIIAAAGVAESLGGENFRSGQTVIDVGVTWSEEKQKIVGDVLFSAAEPIVSAITPVPGGVGSVTAAVLAQHVVRAARAANN